MRKFVAAVDRLSVVCAIVASVMLAVAALVICWNVLYREMGHSTYWEIEFSVYMMVAALFLASPYCLQTNGHVGVDLLSHYLPPGARRKVAVAVMVIGLLVCIYLAIAGGLLTWEAVHRGDRSESTWAPAKWPLFLTMPVGMALTALQYLADLFRAPSPTSDH